MFCLFCTPRNLSGRKQPRARPTKQLNHAQFTHNDSISAHQIAHQCRQTCSGSGPAHVQPNAKARSRNLAKVAPKDNFKHGPKYGARPSRRKVPDPTWIAKLPPAASLGQSAAAHPASADAMAPIWIANVSSNSPRRSYPPANICAG